MGVVRWKIIRFHVLIPHKRQKKIHYVEGASQYVFLASKIAAMSCKSGVLTVNHEKHTGIKMSNRLCYFPFAETWLTVVTRRRQCFPQFELSFSLKVKYQFTFQSSLFIFLADNRQKHRVSLEKCSPNSQTYALMSRYLRCVIMSHRVS